MNEHQGLLPAYGIDPLPSLIRKGVPLPLLVVAVLLDCGRAMPLEDIAEQLLDAGVGKPRLSVGRMVLAIRIALRQRYGELKATRFAPDGKLALALHGRALKSVVYHLTRKPEPRRAPVRARDSERLQMTELEAFVAAEPFGMALSAAATVAALIDAQNAPLDLSDIFKLLRAAGVKRATLDDRLNAGKLNRSRLLARDAKGRIGLRNGARIERVRRRVRERLRLESERREQSANRQRVRTDRERVKRLAEAHLDGVRRALLHAAPSAKRPAALAIVDINRRSVRVFDRNGLAGVRGALEEYDVLVGFEIHALLHSLGLDYEYWHLVPLEPDVATIPTDSWTPPFRVRLTTARLVQAGVGRALTPHREYARLVKIGAFAELGRALDADARGVFAYYRFGVLHECLRFAGVDVGVEYEMMGESNLEQLCRSAKESDRVLDLVLDDSPRLETPWAQSRRVTPIQYLPPMLIASERERIHLIACNAIKEARLAPDVPETNVIPLFDRRVQAFEPPGDERRVLIERLGANLDEERFQTEAADADRWGGTEEAFVNLLVEPPLVPEVVSHWRSARRWTWLVPSILAWVADSSDAPEAARSLAARLLVRRHAAIGGEIAPRPGRDLLMEAHQERLLDWLSWQRPVEPSISSPAELAREAARDPVYGVESLNAHKLARASLGLTPAAANVDLILALQPGPLRDMLAFDLLEERSRAACTLFDHVRDEAGGAEMLRAYHRASLLLHTARCNAAPAFQPLGRAWVSGTGSTKHFRVVVPLRRAGRTLLSDPDTGFGLDDAKACIDRFSGSGGEDRQNVAELEPRAVLVEIELGTSGLVQVDTRRTQPKRAVEGVELPIEDAVRESLRAILKELSGARRDSFASLIKAASLLESALPGASRDIVLA